MRTLKKSSLFAIPTLLAVILAITAGCTGLSSSNVGEPTSQAKFEFKSKLSLLHIGMPADSLEILFPVASKPGETGTLHKAKIVTSEHERVNYTLGWKSDPRHQIGVKDMEEIDVAFATVVAENSRLVSIERFD